MADPKTGCTCGSGGHPRDCKLHPELYRLHIAELNLEGILPDDPDVRAAMDELFEATSAALKARADKIAELRAKVRGPVMDAADAETLTQLGWKRVECSAAWSDAFEHPTGALIQRSLLGVWSGWNGHDGRRTGMTGAPSQDPLTQAARALMDEDALNIATEDDPEAAERWLLRNAKLEPQP